MNKRALITVAAITAVVVLFSLYWNYWPVDNSNRDDSIPVQLPVSPIVSGECYVGGCSGQVCSDEPNAISTCEWSESYACYRTARCERQASGECGWTATEDLKHCLNSNS